MSEQPINQDPIDIPENLQKLLEYGDMGSRHNERIYTFFDIHGEERIKCLGWADKVLDKRCPRDGVRLVLYNGDPHDVMQCPNCNYPEGNYLEYKGGEPYGSYSKEKDLTNLKSELEKAQEKVNELTQWIELIQIPNHQTIRANLEDKAMRKQNNQ